MQQIQLFAKKVITHLIRKPSHLIIIITILIISCLSPLIVSELTRSGHNITIKNQKLLDTSNAEIKTIKQFLSNVIGDDPITINIREDSIHSKVQIYSDEPTKIITFLIDIDSIRQTYEITVFETNQPLTGPSVEIKCPKISDSKYPDSECQTTYNTSHTVDLWLPYEFTLDTGEKVIVKDTTIESNGKNLQIYLYSCDNLNPPLETTESLIKNWVKDVVKDPLADKYQYPVRYGYCENDPIAPLSQN